MEKQLKEVMIQKLLVGANGKVNLKDPVNPVYTNKMFDTNHHYNQQEIGPTYW